MAWDKVWEEIYRKQEWGKYPEIPIVRFIARNYYKVNRSKIRILDLGCGPGAHSWYLAREGFDVYGIDGSPTAINRLKTRLKRERLGGSFVVGDIARLPYENEFFNCVLDSAAIQHNRAEDIIQILKEVYMVLKKDGKFVGMMVADDKTLKKNYGAIHFFKKEELKHLFKYFKQLKIDYVEYSDNNETSKHKSYVVQAIK